MKNKCTAKGLKIKGVLLVKRMTVKEYAWMAGVSEQTVTASLRKGKLRIGIVRYERFGRHWSVDVIPSLVTR